jgi:hypothetical protein
VPLLARRNNTRAIFARQGGGVTPFPQSEYKYQNHIAFYSS